MSVVVILLTWIAVSFGAAAVIAAINAAARAKRELERQHRARRIRAQLQRIIASM